MFLYVSLRHIGLSNRSKNRACAGQSLFCVVYLLTFFCFINISCHVLYVLTSTYCFLLSNKYLFFFILCCYYNHIRLIQQPLSQKINSFLLVLLGESISVLLVKTFLMKLQDKCYEQITVLHE